MGNKLTIPHQLQPDAYSELPKTTFNTFLGQGRFLKAALCNHDDQGLVVVKVYQVRGEAPPPQQQQQELDKYRNILQKYYQKLLDCKHACVCSPSMLLVKKGRGYIVRPYMYSNLRDRLGSRPFLTGAEKRWIMYQLLVCIDQLHARGICHGDLKCDNVCLTSWSHILVTDIAPYKPVYIPIDNTADFTFYFDTMGCGRCTLAPERLIEQHNNKPTGLTWQMDVFSVGCIICDLFLDHKTLFDWELLLKYKSGQYEPMEQLKQLAPELREMIKSMIHIDPAQRLTCSEYLTRYAGVLFPSYYASIQTPIMGNVLKIYPDYKLIIINKLYNIICTSVWFEGDMVIKELVNDEDDQSHFITAPHATQPRTKQAQQQCTHHSNQASSAALTTLTAPTTNSTPPFPPEHLGAFARVPQPPDDASGAKDSSQHEQQPANFPTPPLSVREGMTLLIVLLTCLLRAVRGTELRAQAVTLLASCSHFTDDQTRLQRVIPYLLSLVDDTIATVRALAMHHAVATLACVTQFGGMDIKVVQDYIIPAISKLAHDPEQIVRVKYAQVVPVLAGTAARFLAAAQYRAGEAGPVAGVGGVVVQYERDKAGLQELWYQVVNELVHGGRGGGAKGGARAGGDTCTKRALVRACDILAGYLCDLDDVKYVQQYIPYLNDDSAAGWELKVEFLQQIPVLAPFVHVSTFTNLLLPCLQDGLRYVRGNQHAGPDMTNSFTNVGAGHGQGEDTEQVGKSQRGKPASSGVSISNVSNGGGLSVSTSLCSAALHALYVVHTSSSHMLSRKQLLNLLRDVSWLLVSANSTLRNPAHMFCQSVIDSLSMADVYVLVLPMLKDLAGGEAEKGGGGVHMPWPFSLSHYLARQQLAASNPKQEASKDGTTGSIRGENKNTDELIHVSSCVALVSRIYASNQQTGDAFGGAVGGMGAGKRGGGSKNGLIRDGIGSEEGLVNVDAQLYSIEVPTRAVQLGETLHSLALQQVMLNAQMPPTDLPPQHTPLPPATSSTTGSTSSLVAPIQVPRPPPSPYDMLQIATSSRTPLANGDPLPPIASKNDTPPPPRVSPKPYPVSNPASSSASPTPPRSPPQPPSTLGPTPAPDGDHADGSCQEDSLAQQLNTYLDSLAQYTNPGGSGGGGGGGAGCSAWSHTCSEASLLTHSLQQLSQSYKESAMLDTTWRAHAPPPPASLAGSDTQRSRDMPGAGSGSFSEYRSTSEFRESYVACEPVGVLVGHLPEHQHAVTAIQPSTHAQNGGFFVSTSADGTAKVWDVGSLVDSCELYSKLTYYTQGGLLTGCALAGDGVTCVTSSTEGSLHVWQVDRGVSQNVTTNFGAKKMQYTGITGYHTFDPGWGGVMTVRQHGALTLFTTPRGGLCGYDVRCGRCVWRVNVCDYAGSYEHICTDIMGGYWVVGGSNRGYLGLWDTRFQLQVSSWRHPMTRPIDCLSTACAHQSSLGLSSIQTTGGAGSGHPADSAYVYVSAGQKEVSLWDVQQDTPKCVQVVRTLQDTESSGIPPQSLGPVQIDPLPKLTAPQGVSPFLPHPSIFDGPRGLPSHQRTSGADRLGRKELRDSSRRSRDFRALVPLPSGKLLTGGNDRCIRLWDLCWVDRSRIVNGPIPLDQYHNITSHLNSNVAQNNQTNKFHKYSLRYSSSPKYSRRQSNHEQVPVIEEHFTPLGGGMLDSSPTDLHAHDTDRARAQQHSMESSYQTNVRRLNESCHFDSITALSVVQHGGQGLLVSGSRDGIIKLWK